MTDTGDGPADAAAVRADGDGASEAVDLSVPGMDCASCAGKVESSVSRLDGVERIDARPTTGRLRVTYDGSHTDADAVAGRVEAAGYEVADVDGAGGAGGGSGDATTLRLSVPTMDCASCAGKVSNALDGVAGVREYDTLPTTGTVVVELAPDADVDAVVAAVEAAGYEVESSAAAGGPSAAGDRGSVWRSRRAVATWLAAALTAGGFLLANPLTGATGPALGVGGTSVPVGVMFYLGAVVLAGAAVFRNGYYSLRNRSLDMDLLMSVAIAGAVVVSVGFAEPFYFEAAMLATLFGVAELLEEYAMDRARTSLRELMDLSPDEATVLRDGAEVTVPVESVAVGETVAVRPGEKIPRDGVVREGTSAVNQAPVTGESVPVDKTAGDEVFAGTVNEEGYLEVEVTSAVGEDTIARVVELVEDAQSNRTEREQFVERFAGYYTPVVVTAAVLLAVVPPLAFGASWQTYVVYGLTLVVLACPCAFVISTPVTVVSGLTSAARNGVLVKGGDHLEAMGEVDAVAFDKTGTLTRGELAVTDVVPLGDRTEADVLACARGLELRSEHPIGDAIVAHAEAEAASAEGAAGGGERAVAGDGATDGERAVDGDGAALAGREVSGFESITGKGVAAELDGRQHYAGKPGLFEDLGFDLSHVHAATDGGVVTRTSRRLCERNNCLDLLEDTVPALQAEGKTVVLVGTEDELEGVIAVADEVRPEARRTVERLREAGVATAMLTGDNDRTARAIAEAVGVDDYRAELLPEEKVDAVEDMLDEHGNVAMVGDGINDAPALATATVGIAMGAAGTDTALETADVALMADDLTKLPYLYELAHAANGVIRQNVWTSLGAKAALALGVPFGLVPIWAAVLVGDAGMTTGVTANAMRLARISPDDEGAAAGDDAASGA